MSGAEAAFLEQILDRGFELEQPDCVRDSSAVLSGAFGNLLLRQVEFVGEALERVRLLDRVKVLALQVFNQRHFQRHLFRDVAHNRGDAGKAGPLCRAPATLAGNQLVAVSNSARNERLNDSTRADRARKLFERFLPEASSRLIGAGVNQVDIDLQQAISRRQRYRCSRHLRLAQGRRHLPWRCCWQPQRWHLRWRRLRLGLPNQCAQAPAQRVSWH